MMRERPSKEEKDKASEEAETVDTEEIIEDSIETETLAAIEAELEELDITPVQTTAQPPKKMEVVPLAPQEAQAAAFTAKLGSFESPEWVKKPWMYARPRKATQLNSWLETWGDLVVSYAEFYQVHLVNLLEHSKQHPFVNTKNGKKLTLRELQEIGSHLEARELAKWWNERRTTLRVFWRSLDEWAYEIELYLRSSGMIVEVLTVEDIQGRIENVWASLPVEDIVAVFNIYVDKGKAAWANREKTAIHFLL